MSRFVIPNPDGSIKSVNQCAEIDQGLQDPDAIFYDQEVTGHVSDLTHYVSGGGIVARAALTADFDTLTITADGVDEASLTGLPDPCTVYVDGVATAVTGGEFIFAAASWGTYVIEVDEVAYLPKRWEIIAE